MTRTGRVVLVFILVFIAFIGVEFVWAITDPGGLLASPLCPFGLFGGRAICNYYAVGNMLNDRLGETLHSETHSDFYARLLSLCNGIGDNAQKKRECYQRIWISFDDKVHLDDVLADAAKLR